MRWWGVFTVKLNATNAYGFDWENKTGIITITDTPPPPPTPPPTTYPTISPNVINPNAPIEEIGDIYDSLVSHTPGFMTKMINLIPMVGTALLICCTLGAVIYLVDKAKGR